MPFWSRGGGSVPNTSVHPRSDTGPSDETGARHVDGEVAVSPQLSPPTTSISDTPSRQDMTAASEPWTRFLPEAFGIRDTIEASPLRWCVREAALWGVATGTAMGLHRMRMGSHGLTAMKATFGTMCLVMFPSYYFCAKRREHQERVIEMMMAANDFRRGEEMPETVPLDNDHPFLNVGDGREEDQEGLQKEFVAKLKARKDWQEPQPTQDAEDVFREVKSTR